MEARGQTTLDLFGERRIHPRNCAAVRKTCDIGGGKAQCGAYGDGKTWTSCIGLGRCTIADGPYELEGDWK